MFVLSYLNRYIPSVDYYKFYILKCPERRIWVTTSSFEKGIATVLPGKAAGALSICLSLQGWEVAGPQTIGPLQGLGIK